MDIGGFKDFSQVPAAGSPETTRHKIDSDSIRLGAFLSYLSSEDLSTARTTCKQTQKLTLSFDLHCENWVDHDCGTEKVHNLVTAEPEQTLALVCSQDTLKVCWGQGLLYTAHC